MMKQLLIATCALLALPGAALAQHRGDSEPHGGGGGSHGGAGGARGGSEVHGGGEVRGGGEVHGGFRGGFPSGGFHAHLDAGPIGRFGARDFDAWRGGFWWHGFRGGRIGWWWLADGFWYWYDAPVYPYPGYVGDYYVPSEAYAPPGQILYYCSYPAGYYPYVRACPTGWRVVPADGPGGPP
jgi:hypothetical protein